MNIEDQYWEAYWLNSVMKILEQTFNERLDRLAERLGL